MYLSCHGAMWKQYGEKLIEQLLELCDCAVYYYPPEGRMKSDTACRFDLAYMDLMVIPVTAALLCKPNRTMEFDFPFAQAQRIPVLPLLQEEGLEQTFNQRFGHLQFLREGDSDRTAIPYREKLGNFLKSVLIGNELTDEIRKAFCARIFLSYRKKDRALAQKLMQLVHEDPQLRDVAIWYDEFLTPGDDFDKNITQALQDSDLFLLAVTPNVLEPDNYVMTDEYPAANGVLPVVAAQLEPTDPETLQSCFPDLEEPVDAYDTQARMQRLRQVLQEKLRAEETPHHRYLMGMAYLSGVDVEKDPQRAVRLLEQAAEDGEPEAAKKLAFLYHWGDRVPRNYGEAKRWIARLLELTRGAMETQGDEDSAWALYQALQTAQMICSSNLDYRAAQNYGAQAIRVAQQLHENCGYSARYVADGYQAMGELLSDSEDHQKAYLYRKKALELGQRLLEADRSMEMRRYMVDRYCDLAETCQELERLQEAVDDYNQAQQLLQVICKARQDPSLVRELMELHQKLCDLLKELGDKRQAKQYAKEADQLFAAYKGQLPPGDLTAWMSAASYYLARDKAGKAIRMLEKALDLARRQAGDTYGDRKSLALTYDLMGTLWEIKRRDKKAREYYLLENGIFSQLAEEYPCPQTTYDLADSYASLGSTYDKSYILEPEEVFYSDFRLPKRDRETVCDALICYQTALHLLTEMETDKSLPEHQKRETELLEAEGRLYKALGRKQEAIDCYRRYRQQCLQLYETLGSDVSGDRYAEACYRLAMMTLDREMMEEAYYLWTELSRRNPRYIKKKKEALRLLKL